MTDEVSRSSTAIEHDIESQTTTTHQEANIQYGDKELDSFEVKFEEGDKANPQNWSNLKRWYLTMLAGLVLLNATFASSVPTGIVPQLEEKFTFSNEVATLTISLFLAGYCLGPLVWGPLSEQYGRRPIFVLAFGVYTAFQVGCALSPNTAAILIFRFLSGCFASAPLSNSGAVISDMWDAAHRGNALAVFTLAPFAGPALGPIVSGFMAVAGVSWRWVFWVLTFFAAGCLILLVLTLQETYAPVLLAKRAAKLRKETGDDRWWAPMDRQQLRLSERVEAVLARPFKILFREPMLIAMTTYMSFVYGCIYLLFEAYPIVYTIGHGFNAGFTGLTFLPILIGGVVSVVIYLVYWNPRYEGLQKRFAPSPVPPEYRLEMAAVAAPVFAASFFWFGWTSFPSVSYWAPIISTGFLGLSTLWIFLALFNYMIDAYLMFAASALAANAVVRSLFGVVFPLFATQMYDALGARWASSLIGFIAVIMIPIPLVLIKYGPVLRARSRYAPTKPPQPTTSGVPMDAEAAETIAENVEAEKKDKSQNPRDAN